MTENMNRNNTGNEFETQRGECEMTINTAANMTMNNEGIYREEGKEGISMTDMRNENVDFNELWDDVAGDIVSVTKAKMAVEGIPEEAFDMHYSTDETVNLFRADVSEKGMREIARFCGEVSTQKNGKARNLGRSSVHCFQDCVRAISNKRETYQINSFSKSIGVVLFKYHNKKSDSDLLVWDRRKLNRITYMVKYILKNDDGTVTELPEEFDYIEIALNHVLDKEYIAGKLSEQMSKILEYLGAEEYPENLELDKLDFDSAGYCIDFSRLDKNNINRIMDEIGEKRIKPRASYVTDQEVVSTYIYRDTLVMNHKGMACTNSFNYDFEIRKPVKSINNAVLYDNQRAIEFFRFYYVYLLVYSTSRMLPETLAEKYGIKLTESETELAMHIYKTLTSFSGRQQETAFVVEHPHLFDKYLEIKRA